MSVKSNFYDVFAHTLPGALAIVIFLYLFHSLGYLLLDFQIVNNISGQLILALLGCSFLIGKFLDSLSYGFYRIYGHKNITQQVITDFKTRYPFIELNLVPSDLYVLRARLSLENQDVASDADRVRADYHMTRTICFEMFVVALIAVGLYIYSNLLIIHLIIAILSLFLMVIFANQAKRFDPWFLALLSKQLLRKK